MLNFYGRAVRAGTSETGETSGTSETGGTSGRASRTGDYETSGTGEASGSASRTGRDVRQVGQVRQVGVRAARAIMRRVGRMGCKKEIFICGLKNNPYLCRCLNQ